MPSKPDQTARLDRRGFIATAAALPLSAAAAPAAARTPGFTLPATGDDALRQRAHDVRVAAARASPASTARR